jgi:hypothetical protein
MGPGRQMQMSVKPRVKRDFGTDNIDDAVKITEERYMRSLSDLQRHHTQGTLRTTSDIGRVEDITNLRKTHLDMKRMQRIKQDGNLAQEMTLSESKMYNQIENTKYKYAKQEGQVNIGSRHNPAIDE